MKNKDGLNWEVSVGVTFASFMGAVTLFFTGVLISQYKSFDSTIRVPLLLLIIATFSFIFAASIYSNAGAEITADNTKAVKKYLIYANNIFEFLGLYLFIIATPLVIGSITQDNFFRIATALVSVVGVALYSQSNFSVIHKELKEHSSKFVFVLVLTLASVGLYLSQYAAQNNALLSYNYVATFLLLYLSGATVYFCARSDQYKLS